ncbi:MAG TPA: hypothetical protein VFN10_11340 [Thermoanaerobaculia bacterium]|nr:hypothetical protein [Thermoanaerobaculia bacterium]
MRRATALLLVCLVASSAIGQTAPPPAEEEIVAFNIRSAKYHCLQCSAARACTHYCIEIKRSEAKARGGVACKLCAGTCRRD